MLLYQSSSCVGKTHNSLAIREACGIEIRTLEGNRLTIGFGESDGGETLSDRGFFRRVDVFRFAQIERDNLSSERQRKSHRLSLAQSGPIAVRLWFGGFGEMGRELDPVEGQVVSAP